MRDTVHDKDFNTWRRKIQFWLGSKIPLSLIIGFVFSHGFMP